MDEELRSPHGCSAGDGGYACNCNRIDVTRIRVSESRFRVRRSSGSSCRQLMKPWLHRDPGSFLIRRRLTTQGLAARGAGRHALSEMTCLRQLVTRALAPTFHPTQKKWSFRAPILVASESLSSTKDLALIVGGTSMSTGVMTQRIETSPRLKGRIIGAFYLLTILTGIFAQVS